MSWLDTVKSPNFDERLPVRTAGTGVYTLRIDRNVSIKAVPQWLHTNSAYVGMYKTEVHFDDSKRVVFVPASRPSVKQAISAGLSHYRSELIQTLVSLDQDYFDPF